MSSPTSGIWEEEYDTSLPTESQFTHVQLMEVEKAVPGVIPEYPIKAWLSSDLVTKKAMTQGQRHYHAP